MKIGILTQPLTNNYGGILQNYAMQQVLIRLGHEPITIRIAHGWQNMTFGQFTKAYPKYFTFYVLQKLKGRTVQLPEPIWKWKKHIAGIEDFISNHIVTTSFVNGPDLNMDFVIHNKIDSILVGSDQVWHGGLPYMSNVYFCGFARNGKLKRISYAASFGFDKWRGNDEQTKEARELISFFDAVGVREEAGVEICRNFLGREDAQWVLDPTMLLERKDYLQLCNCIQPKTDSFVFAYILDNTDEKKQLVERVAEEMGSKIYYLGVKKVKGEDRIENWLSMFRDAKYVVTDSYHGTVFSLIFEKEFVSIYNPGRGNSRMDSLKKLTGLEDRFIKESPKYLPNRIDYNIVSKKIDTIRCKSMCFLKEALCK